MRRIFITPNIIELSKDYSKNLFKDRNQGRGRRFSMPIEELNKLESNLRTNLFLNYANYVKRIIDHYGILNSIKPQYFDSLYNRYFDILTEIELSTIIKLDNTSLKFYEWIVSAMRYDAIREKEFLPYAKKLGIKTCVYCNTQFAITTELINGKLSGSYELDHYYPKSKYPFLCTSFFNLQPSCSHCNKKKINKTSLFSLYTDDYTLIDEFNFSLDKKSMLRYLLTQEEDNLKIIFNCINTILKDNHEDLFHISELYNQHKDVVEEIIWKSKIYNKSYKESLSNSFSSFFPNTTNLNRFIIGNYDNPNEIHKRPLAKLVQDIAKQLGVI